MTISACAFSPLLLANHNVPIYARIINVFIKQYTLLYGFRIWKMFKMLMFLIDKLLKYL